jgi:hypothetical protein
MIEKSDLGGHGVGVGGNLPDSRKGAIKLRMYVDRVKRGQLNGARSRQRMWASTVGREEHSGMGDNKREEQEEANDVR